MTSLEQDKEHLRLLSVFHYVGAGIIAVVACIPMLHIAFGLFLMAGPVVWGGPAHNTEPPAWLGLLFAVAGGVAVLLGFTLATLVFLGGRCLARRKSCNFCLVVAGLSCVFMPLGTALGVFTIIVLMRPSVKPLFR